MDFDAAREKMVLEQLVDRGIKNQEVIRAFLKVPRHLFVEQALRERAYGDYPLPIGLNQTISQPYMVALMCELLELKGNEKVLEIGTGSGYETAILA
ncbi:MAG: protein-L-isoaspartate O-methyltransferase, partial [Nitrospinota bacterium]|nr:protein-L-isoaspartate O-methyltransferase [Nitrospinota bacterium]